MARPGFPFARVTYSLSARVLVLTLFFVMVSEVLIYVPSIASFRMNYLKERVQSAQLASLALEATPDRIVSTELERNLLDQAEILAVVVKREDVRSLILGSATPDEVGPFYDIRGVSLWVQVRDAFAAMGGNDHAIRVVDSARGDPSMLIDVVMAEDPMRREMYAYSGRILSLSLIISIFTAGLVFFSLNRLLVRPMARITESMVRFREAPEDVSRSIVPTSRRDEIGVAQRELADMQVELRAALRQKEHLVQLGTAVAKINHDLRNILSTAQLVSDRLAVSGDPEVRRLTPTLVQAIDRAVDLCTQTLQYGRASETVPRRIVFKLRELIDDVGDALGLSAEGVPTWENEVVADLELSADRDQIFRVILNLCRNAADALGEQEDGRICITGGLKNNCATIYVVDNGPGLPDAARTDLFKPFQGSTRACGTGLGLAVARDLVVGHGGEITLHKSDEFGTTFRLAFPSNVHELPVVRPVEQVG